MKHKGWLAWYGLNGLITLVIIGRAQGKPINLFLNGVSKTDNMKSAWWVLLIFGIGVILSTLLVRERDGVDEEGTQLFAYRIGTGAFTMHPKEARKAARWFCLFLAVMVQILFTAQLLQIALQSTVLSAWFGWIWATIVVAGLLLTLFRFVRCARPW
ncbi:hypothetical protein [uncultured Dubosiella sp.]|uniref:hypothetical protein n=1 Tax=uncultured Dubosiella sp. TaxID=1937011 RepID=UPI00272F99CB|nr:hypothetical protein [uncultured Dubosiella sp.]